MKNNNNYQELKKTLYQLVKMDYGFGIYNDEENIIRFSFYHLDSVYNAFCTSVKVNNDDNFSTPSVEWQYATPNKKAEKYACKVVSAIIALKAKKRDEYNDEVEYYKNLSEMVYNAKYATKVWLHTES